MEEIRLFLWTHPWWHAALVLVPPIVISSILTLRELHHSAQANRLRQANTDAVTKIGDLENERNGLVRERNELEREKNALMQKIAENTKRPLSTAEKNCLKLRKYLRKTAQVSEGAGNWGAMGAEIVEASEDNIVTLFVRAGHSSSVAFAVYVHCDDLQIIEEPVGSCGLQLRILERYGDTRQLGEIKKWDDRLAPSTQPPPRGETVFYASYIQPPLAEVRRILIYAPTSGNPQYTLATEVNGRKRARLSTETR